MPWSYYEAYPFLAEVYHDFAGILKQYIELSGSGSPLINLKLFLSWVDSIGLLSNRLVESI